jgi:hypothetical protein
MAVNYLGKLEEYKKPDGTPILALPILPTLSVGTVQNTSKLLVRRATDNLNNGKSTSIQNASNSTASSVKNLPSVVRNPLEQFASYSVLWTLACLTPIQFNNPASYRNSPQELKNIIFSSGGRYTEQRARTLFGTPEYYINNFQMNTVVGASAKSGNSNAIKFSFDILEPYSMGLLLQSMQSAAVSAGYLDYLKNAPYVLRMDIKGYDELGINISSLVPKFFTLKLTSMRFSVTESGSSYKVDAIPYNHQAFSDSVNVTYNDIKISGGSSGTVEEILSTGENSLMAVLNRNEEQLKAENKIEIPDQYAIQFPKLANEWYSSAGTPQVVKKATLNPNIALPKIIAGASADKNANSNLPVNDVGLASLGFDQLSGGNPLFSRADDIIDPVSGIVRRDGITIDPTTRAFQFGQNQSLTAIINQVILSSDYAKKAITVDPTPEGYIKWFKLDIQVELLTLDSKTGDYARKITYRVVPFFVHQSIFSNPSSAPVGYPELMKQIVKEYNYIYTGENTDILKFDIDINNLFFSGLNPSPENKGAKTANQDQNGIGERLNNTTQTGQGQAPAVQGAQAGRARVAPDPALLARFKGGSGDKTTEQVIAENFQYAFISGSSADLVTIDLEILGDTFWLVDSGMGNYFAKTESDKSQITNDGTMNYEGGSVYIYLTFKTPSDVNELTGLYDFSAASKESPFGGIYKIVSCENTFNDGVWKQKLKCLRMPGPQGPEVNKALSGNVPVPVIRSGNLATVVTEQETAKTTPNDDTASQMRTVPATSPTPPQKVSGNSQFSKRNVAEGDYSYYNDIGN